MYYIWNLEVLFYLKECKLIKYVKSSLYGFFVKIGFFFNVYYLYLFSVQVFNCFGLVYEFNVILVDEDYRFISMLLL